MVDLYVEGDRIVVCFVDEYEMVFLSYIEVVFFFGEKVIGCLVMDICYSDMMIDCMCVVRIGNLKICLYF